MDDTCIALPTLCYGNIRGKMQIVLLALQIITPGEEGAGPNMKH